MSRRHEESYQQFEALRHRARLEVNRGDWQAALATCDLAITWAEEFGDRDARDLAHCNRAGILVNQGRGGGDISKLRRILLSSTNPEICHQVANNIARFHEHRKESKQGMFYARLALDHAKRTRKPEYISRSYNQLGLLLGRDSYFEEANDCFGEALGLLPEEPGRDRAMILYNLGYCQTLLGHSMRGFSLLFSSLRMFKREGEVWEMYPQLGLSFAYLELDRPGRSAAHARRGLLLAEEVGMTWQVKNALYLLGESEKLCGHELSAHRFFTRLQREFYPDDPVIPDLLMMTDVRKLINLMA